MDAFSFGQYLRESRESREVELAEVVAALRIRQPILEAFESGDFVGTNMSQIQIRGMLRIYARFLELDDEHVLRLYDEMRMGSKQRRRWRLRKKAPEDSREDSQRDSAAPMQEIDIEQSRAARRGGWWRLIVLLLFSAAAIAIIAFVTLELIGDPLADESENDSTLSGATAVIVPTATFRPVPTATPTMVSPTPSNRARYGGNGILASILLTQRTWIRVSTDGIERYAGIAVPDTLLEYDAISEILVSASNAKALDVLWNGQQQGPFGGRGQRVDIRFYADEVVFSTGVGSAPTPVSPTAPPTATPLPTHTPVTPSSTPGPSPTASLTPVPIDTLTFTPAPTVIPSDTPTPSLTPTVTDTPTITITSEPTAILPPRVTQEGLIATKEGA